MMTGAYAVIMAGGRGERFWPLSTRSRPKQLLTVFGGKPLLTLAAERLRGLIPPERTLVITTADLVAATRAAVPALPSCNVVGEPVGRDTAPAVALGTALIAARDPCARVCVLTADQIVRDLGLFRRCLRSSLEIAGESDVLVTIGIAPTGPNTGFGYIEAGRRRAARRGIEFYAARRFVEKPDLATARRYVASGRYYWNSGMFVWSVRAVAGAFERSAPEILRLLEPAAAAAGTRRFARALASAYARMPKISVDYAIMEKAPNILMVKGEFFWDDVGSWAAVARHFPADAAGNVAVGWARAVGSSGNIVVSPDRLTGLVGVRDLIVVHAPGATLVCARDCAQDVKRLVAELRSGRRFRSLL